MEGRPDSMSLMGDASDSDRYSKRRGSSPNTRKETGPSRPPAWEGSRHTPITSLNCASVLDLLQISKGTDFVSVTITRRDDSKDKGEFVMQPTSRMRADLVI